MGTDLATLREHESKENDRFPRHRQSTTPAPAIGGRVDEPREEIRTRKTSAGYIYKGLEDNHDKLLDVLDYCGEHETKEQGRTRVGHRR